MPSLYNRVAGQNVERLAALSDGIFAVAMTLLVLDLRVPAAEAVHSGRDLHALIPLSPLLLIFLMSVMTLGIFWGGQQTQLNHFDRKLAWIHIAFLCCVSLAPFSTSLLAEYIHYEIALRVYWFNIFLLGATLLWSWSYGTRADLVSQDAPADIHASIVRRILIAPSLYAAGAALCFLNTYYSIAAIVLV